MKYLFSRYLRNVKISRNSINLGENIEIADNHPKIEKKIEIEIKSDKIKSQPQSA